ncbi:MAG: 2-amino-4-hydroxy-6-hydroxymethyldihydropteridine diphosphokinase [Thermomonas sp.]|uniref:2-amino-4-hydroxy-6- hydroxymethyldihydropteridine diphosphokinase n=1 Tax=Thermomonas sp. TaxID=1971895 RepID=UPI0039E38D01
MSPSTHACIGLGANLGHPQEAVRAAIRALDDLPQSRVLAASRLYRTPAWGNIEQPDFVNAAVLLETRLDPRSLLEHLLDIERRAGRMRGGDAASVRWGPRVIDLDLLLYGERTINIPGLRVPHPHLHERAFALVPLAEIAPTAPFPGHGSVGEALRHIDAAGVEAISDLRDS